jgi:type II secretory ATPase GspE/PulE/Tfp pilus assembly ATPase PilB-like protein
MTQKREVLDMDDQSDGVILVMGVTGAGKSYFLNQLKSQSVIEGHSLFSGKYYCLSPRFYTLG